MCSTQPTAKRPLANIQVIAAGAGFRRKLALLAESSRVYCFHLTLTEIWRNPCRCRLGSSFLRVLTGSDRDMTRGVRGANCARAKDVWQASRVSADVTTDTTPLQITECTGRRLTICSCYRLTSCICRTMTHCTCRRCYDMKPMLYFRYVQIGNCGLTVLVVFDSSCYSALLPFVYL